MVEKKKIKIALMSYAMDNRAAKGTALHTRKVIENILEDDRFEFYLVHYDKVDDPIYSKAKEIIMPKISLPYGSHFISQLLFFWRYRKTKFDIIHWFQPRLYPFYWLAPANKIVATLHAAGDITAPGFFVFSKEVFNFVLRKFNKWGDIFIAGSEFGKEEIVEHYGIPKEKVFVTFNGVREDFQLKNKKDAFEKIKNKYKVPSNFIFDLSRLQPHKNINGLIKAYILMRDKYNRDEKLVIVGGSVRGHEQTYALANKSVYKDDIYFIDYVDNEDLNDFYSAATIFVFPSLNEGFGIPIIEAMAAGTPVITSDIASMPEIAGEAGILVNPSDVDDIANKMNTLLADKNLQEDLISRGVVRAKEFTWQEVANKTKKIYLSLVD